MINKDIYKLLSKLEKSNLPIEKIRNEILKSKNNYDFVEFLEIYRDLKYIFYSNDLSRMFNIFLRPNVPDENLENYLLKNKDYIIKIKDAGYTALTNHRKELMQSYRLPIISIIIAIIALAVSIAVFIINLI